MAKRNILKAIGPGLLWAGAAIGVSHIVQSTRAGANFGFELIWINATQKQDEVIAKEIHLQQKSDLVRKSEDNPSIR